MRDKEKRLKKICFVIFVIALFIDTAVLGLFYWFRDSYGVTFREIIYTIKSPLSGANSSFFLTSARYVLPKIAVFAVVFAAVYFVLFRFAKIIDFDVYLKGRSGGEKKIDGLTALSLVFMIAALAFAAFTLQEIDKRLDITGFIRDYNARTQIYDDYYVMPNVAAIQPKEGGAKNLLYIYMESMETTYASKEVGGEQPEINYIPNLTRLANDNVSFSDEEGLGGFISAKNTDWTMSAIWATETGAAFAFPIEGNSDFGNQEHFARNTLTLGDILEQKGYTQEFLCGSDAKFGGRKAFFEQHGNFRVYDLYTAEDEGYLTPSEEVNWGIEDWRLYDIAKDELTRIASEGRPFNFTMLTVDTHHFDGWICPRCEDTYPEQLANVVTCADKQIGEFIDWCSRQDWYDDTVIIIQGDHPRMDQSLVSYAKDRMVYNCFINAACDPASLDMKSRSWNTMDMFPTILSAMGFEVPDSRLGLGTDMFSGKKTLCETIGSDYIDVEVMKYSQFYADNFY
ncbi:MAG: LTA synthase family protein [Lachnospiraceae bacterium]|nr:LTA synthase family protein [Lachnospiraceae bacterium]